MSYQQGGYTNVPSQETDSNPHRSAYEDYVQNNSYSTPLPSTFGSYGPNVGSADWVQINRRSKRNRLYATCAAAFFFLFAIFHLGGGKNNIKQQHGHNVDYYPHQNHGEHPNQNHKGIAGDGHERPANHDHPTDHPGDGHETPANHGHPTDHPLPDSHNEHEHVTYYYYVGEHEDSGGEEHKNADEVKIALLLTYPMSGTSFTMKLFGMTTNTSIATTYPSHTLTYYDKNDNPVPVYSDPSYNKELNGPGSPYWAIFSNVTTHPKNYVLTLSHCRGYCDHPCQPHEYIQSFLTFEEGCRTILDVHDSKKKYYIPERKVAKMLHLIREPMSNIVSRFHSVYSREQLHSKYGENKEGFMKWCENMDADSKFEHESTLISAKIKELMKGVPCHSEFYKYVAWHNRVVELGWNNYRDNTLVVYFEDYNTVEKESEQARRMAEFVDVKVLEMDKEVPTLWKQLQVRMYQDYYTEEQRKNIERFVRALAFDKTMVLLERYFEK